MMVMMMMMMMMIQRLEMIHNPGWKRTLLCKVVKVLKIGTPIMMIMIVLKM